MTSTINASTTAGIVQTADTSGALALQTAGTTAMTIDGNQNVLVGTTTGPNNGKGIVIYEATYPRLTLRNSTTGTASTDGYGLVGVGADLYVENAEAGNTVFTTGNTERMRIDSSGNLMAGSTSPVSGALLTLIRDGAGVAVGSSTSAYRRMYYNAADGYMYFWNGSNQAYLTSAGIWTNVSDARLKTNLRDIEHGLEDVLKVRCRSFERTDVDGTYVGFVAQELQQVIPEVVSGDPETQLGVDYGSLVAVAFKAIQELKAELDELKSKVTV